MNQKDRERLLKASPHDLDDHDLLIRIDERLNNLDDRYYTKEKADSRFITRVQAGAVVAALTVGITVLSFFGWFVSQIKSGGN